MQWSENKTLSFDEILKTEKDKRCYFCKIRDTASAIDNTAMDRVINETVAKYGSLPDIEYSMLGNGEYGFFYTLVEAFFTAINNAKGDKDIVEDLTLRFRKCYNALYIHNIVPDVKALSSWTALSTGTLKSPYMYKVYNNNQQLALAENSPNIPECITDLKNTPYPLHMPYLEYTPEQRVLFDEFVHYMSYVQEMRDGGRKIGDALKEYKYNEIKQVAKDMCANVDESLIEEKAELDEINVRLAQRFDYYLKCLHYTISDLELQYKYQADEKFMGKEQRKKGVVAIPSRLYDGKTMNLDHINIRDAVALSRGLLRILKPIDGLVALRLGFALTSPLLIAKIKNKSLAEKLRYIDEYYAFKKTIFIPNVLPLTLKPDSEIANIPFPTYSALLEEDDCISIVPSPYCVDRINATDSGSFRWVSNFTTVALQRYTVEIRKMSQCQSFDCLMTIEETKESIGIPMEYESYDGPYM